MQQHLLNTEDDAVVIFGSSFPNDQEYTQVKNIRAGALLTSHKNNHNSSQLQKWFLTFNLDFQLVLLRSVSASEHVVRIPASEVISVVMVTRFLNRVVSLSRRIFF